MVSRRDQLISEICNKPCLPGMNSINAPNSLMPLTGPSYTSPTSGTAVIPFTHANAFSRPAFSEQKMLT